MVVMTVKIKTSDEEAALLVADVSKAITDLFKNVEVEITWNDTDGEEEKDESINPFGDAYLESQAIKFDGPLTKNGEAESQLKPIRALMPKDLEE